MADVWRFVYSTDKCAIIHCSRATKERGKRSKSYLWGRGQPFDIFEATHITPARQKPNGKKGRGREDGSFLRAAAAAWNRSFMAGLVFREGLLRLDGPSSEDRRIPLH
jgi:hypothetical protein